MREMRRKERQLTDEQAWRVVDASDYGILSMMGEENRPYQVPLSLARKGTSLYFHCAKVGQKVDFLRQNSGVCVSFVAKADLDGENLTTKYLSATVFGKAEEVTDDSEKTEALTLIARRFAPGFEEAAKKEIEMLLSVTAIWRIDCDFITAKSNLER